MHIASVISVGLFLSILFESSAAALGASLLCWLAAAVLIPSASPYVAEAFIGERRTDIDEAVERLRRASDEELERRFLRAILRFRADWSDYAERRDAPILEAIDEMIRTGRGFTSGSEETVPLDPPAFTFDRQPVVERLGGAIYKIGVMFLETVGLFFLGWFWFRRKALVWRARMDDPVARTAGP